MEIGEDSEDEDDDEEEAPAGQSDNPHLKKIKYNI